MDNLTLSPAQSSCGCNETGSQLPELDVRAIPHAIRHAAIHGVVDSLTEGAAFVLVAPHDPLPLLRQIEERHGESIAVDYLNCGPEAWHLRLSRV